MKKNKLLLVVILILFLSNIIFTQTMNKNNITLKTGYYGFKNLSSGWNLCLKFSKPIDNKVDIGIETDLTFPLIVNFSQDVTVLGIASALGNININLGNKNQSPMNYKIGGGVGYQMLLSSFTDYQNNGKVEKNKYRGLLWLLNSSIEYQINKTASFVLDISYNSSSISKDSGAQSNLSIKDKINLSGFGLKFGVAVNLR
jgi:hypothetical protein